MGYYNSELSIDTRTCGQADEDAWLDRRDGIMPRPRIHAAMATRRWQAQQASREQPAQAAWCAALERAGELFEAGYWADSRRVLEIAKEGQQ